MMFNHLPNEWLLLLDKIVTSAHASLVIQSTSRIDGYFFASTAMHAIVMFSNVVSFFSDALLPDDPGSSLEHGAYPLRGPSGGAQHRHPLVG
ncbi:hypothetical protein OPV22_021008 [Ensete ventricosum]|uniref:Uncharacterized protein n=1 Tax=Ensete ventricosum TaxID=4639 RepID=A0AAV8QFV4_ENSVE|nr:hypothetical protein OPV22_021008 [Ensete ventricosum]